MVVQPTAKLSIRLCQKALRLFATEWDAERSIPGSLLTSRTVREILNHFRKSHRVYTLICVYPVAMFREKATIL